MNKFVRACVIIAMLTIQILGGLLIWLFYLDKSKCLVLAIVCVGFSINLTAYMFKLKYINGTDEIVENIKKIQKNNPVKYKKICNLGKYLEIECCIGAILVWGGVLFQIVTLVKSLFV